MPVDTTFYTKKHAQDLGFACQRANHYISVYEDKIKNVGGDPECCQAVITANIKIVDAMPRPRLDMLHTMIEQVLFSSGYFSDITMTKKKTVYDVVIKVAKMTPDQKAICLSTD